MVCTGDRIGVYVDFIPIVFTHSPDDALALLIAMYTIFELSFDKKSRAVRLLYSVLHGDKRFLSNSIRHFMKERSIDIYCEEKYKLSSSSSNLQSTDSASQSQAQLQSDSDLASGSSDQHDPSIIDQAPQANVLTDTRDSNSNMTTKTNE